MGVQNSDAKIRLLLMLWELGGLKENIRKGDLLKKVKKSKEKSQEFTPIFEELSSTGAIALEKAGSSFRIQMCDRGLQVLSEELKNPDFTFPGTIVSTRFANAVLKWHREMGGEATSEAKEPPISSYEEFKDVALDVFETLKRDFHYDTLVPIYRIRRTIGDRVSRSQFDDWMLEMQAEDILELMGGEVNDETIDQKEDSIQPPIGQIRFFAKRLK